jgi:Sulfotransferase family
MTVSQAQPVVIGGNGHSGTRIFLEIIAYSGVSCGIRHLTRRGSSEDLRMIDLLNRWVRPFVYGELDSRSREAMRRSLSRRLRLCFPFRRRPWAFKNPRQMLILPVLHEIFPGIKFVHVIRDGRDIALGNPFVATNRYVDAFLDDNERRLPPEQKMILFWGRSNQFAMDYGKSALGERYMLMRWEDLCNDAPTATESLIRFAGGSPSRATGAAKLVLRPASIGRWETFPPDLRAPVVARGQPWLSMFGYA